MRVYKGSFYSFGGGYQPFMETVMSNKVPNKLDKFGILMKL
jgi:hypothetical protein